MIKAIRKQLPAESILILLNVSLTVFILSQLLSRCFYGFDITDESYYLINIFEPWKYKYTFTQFGFIYHPLTSILGGNIIALRQANIFITYLLSFFLILALLKKIIDERSESGWITNASFLVTISANLATLSFAVFISFTTPSYNSLNFQSLLLTALSLLLLDKKATLKSCIGWFILAIGGWLTFMAKISSAVLLIILVIPYIVLSKRFNSKLFIFSLIFCLALLMISALLIDGSISDFINRHFKALSYTLDLGTMHRHPIRIDSFQFNFTQKIIFLLTTIFCTTLVIFASSDKKEFNKYCLITCTLFVLACMAGLTFNGLINHLHSPFYALLFLSIFCASILSSVVFKLKYKVLDLNRDYICIFSLFVLLPYIYAFGTASNYWIQMQEASIFWIAAGLVILLTNVTYHKRRILIVIVIIAQCMTLIILQISSYFPYRQYTPPDNRYHKTSIRRGFSTIYLPSNESRYVNALLNAAYKNGLLQNTPVIDMTGHSPGIVYFLNANAPETAWLIGGYKGSDSVAYNYLSRINDKELSRAWLLLEPHGNRKFSQALFAKLNINLKESYVQVFRGINPFVEHSEQILLKPKAFP